MKPEDVILAWMRSMLRRRERDATEAPSAQTDRATALGGLGEALVAGVLRDMRWPVLRNVVLCERRGSAELDLVVRAPDAIIVLEVKTWSGQVDGFADAESWVRYGPGGGEVSVPNPVRQNTGHVGIIVRAIADPEVPVFGLVVGAGHAQFAERLRSHVVPLALLPEVLWTKASETRPCPRDALDRAWAVLTREAALSDSRRSAHASWVQIVQRRASLGE